MVENDVDPKLQKVIFLWFLECCHGNMCNLNVIVVLEIISRDLYLLFAIRFSSKFQNSVFYQHVRPKSGLEFPSPLKKWQKSGKSQGISQSEEEILK